MLNKKTFKCKRCGDCCKVYTTKLTKSDIKRIEKRHKKEYFLAYDTFRDYLVLKKVNNKCIFLGKKKNRYFCKIYDIRPDICRKYPFHQKNMESCKPLSFSLMR